MPIRHEDRKFPEEGKSTNNITHRSGPKSVSAPFIGTSIFANQLEKFAEGSDYEPGYSESSLFRVKEAACRIHRSKG